MVTEILVLVHTNEYGLFDVQAWSSYVYFITFINDYLQYGFVYLMHHKFEFFEKFIELKYEVEKQIEKFIKVLQSDREKKYLSQKFQTYLKDNGMV